MQGTVATFDEDTRTGTVLLDDGAQLHFPAAAFDASGIDPYNATGRYFRR